MSDLATSPFSWLGSVTAPSTRESAGTVWVRNIEPSTTWVPGVNWSIWRVATSTGTWLPESLTELR